MRTPDNPNNAAEVLDVEMDNHGNVMGYTSYDFLQDFTRRQKQYSDKLARRHRLLDALDAGVFAITLHTPDGNQYFPTKEKGAEIGDMLLAEIGRELQVLELCMANDAANAWEDAHHEGHANLRDLYRRVFAFCAPDQAAYWHQQQQELEERAAATQSKQE